MSLLEKPIMFSFPTLNNTDALMYCREMQERLREMSEEENNQK